MFESARKDLIDPAHEETFLRELGRVILDFSNHNASSQLITAKEGKKFSRAAGRVGTASNTATIRDLTDPLTTGLIINIGYPLLERDGTQSYLTALDLDFQYLPAEKKAELLLLTLNNLHSFLTKIRPADEVTTIMNNLYIESTPSAGFHIFIKLINMDDEQVAREAELPSVFIYNPDGLTFDKKSSFGLHMNYAEIENQHLSRRIVIAPSIAISKRKYDPSSPNSNNKIILDTLASFDRLKQKYSSTSRLSLVPPQGAVHLTANAHHGDKVVGSYIKLHGTSILDGAVTLTLDEWQRFLEGVMVPFDSHYNKTPTLNSPNLNQKELFTSVGKARRLHKKHNKTQHEKQLLDQLHKNDFIYLFSHMTEITREAPGSKKSRVFTYSSRLDWYLGINFTPKDLLVKKIGLLTKSEFGLRNRRNRIDIPSIYRDDGEHTGSSIYFNYNKQKGLYDYLITDYHSGYQNIKLKISGLLFVYYHNKIKSDENFKHLYPTFNSYIYKTFKFYLAEQSTNPKIKYLSKAGIDMKINSYIPVSAMRSIMNNSSKNVIVKAPTGTGKTKSVVDAAKSLDSIVVIFEPLQMLVDQITSTYAINGIKEGVTGSALTKIFTDAEASLHSKQLGGISNPENSSKSIIVATYDSVDKIKTALADTDIDPESIIAVVDEAHALINNQSYKARVLANLSDFLSGVKKVVYLSATPEVLTDIFEADYYSFNLENRKPLNITLVPKKKNISYTDYLVNKIVATHTPGTIDVALLNNKIKIQTVKEALTEAGLKVGILTADMKNTSLYQEIVKTSQIPADLDVVLTTVVVNDGVNINNTNIGNIYTIQITNPVKIIQYVGRFRKSRSAIEIVFTPVYYAHDIDVKRDLKQLFTTVTASAQKELKRFAAKKAAFTLNNYLEAINKKIDGALDRLAYNSSNSSRSGSPFSYVNFIQTETGFEPRLNTFSLAYGYVGYLEQQLHHPELLKTWLEKSAGAQVTITPTKPLEAGALKTNTKAVAETMEAKRQDALQDIYDFGVEKVIAFYIVKNPDVKVPQGLYLPYYYEIADEIAIAEFDEKLNTPPYNKAIKNIISYTNLLKSIPDIELVASTNASVVGQLSAVFALYAHQETQKLLQQPQQQQTSDTSILVAPLNINHEVNKRLYTTFIEQVNYLVRTGLEFNKKSQIKDYLMNKVVKSLYGVGGFDKKNQILVKKLFNYLFTSTLKIASSYSRVKQETGKFKTVRSYKVEGLIGLKEAIETIAKKSGLSSEAVDFLLHRLENRVVVDKVGIMVGGMIVAHEIEDSDLDSKEEIATTQFSRIADEINNIYAADLVDATILKTMAAELENDITNIEAHSIEEFKLKTMLLFHKKLTNMLKATVLSGLATRYSTIDPTSKDLNRELYDLHHKLLGIVEEANPENEQAKHDLEIVTILIEELPTRGLSKPSVEKIIDLIKKDPALEKAFKQRGKQSNKQVKKLLNNIFDKRVVMMKYEQARINKKNAKYQETLDLMF